jgi:hypothetical protein
MDITKWVSVTGSRTYPVTMDQWKDLTPDEQLECIEKGVALVQANLNAFPDDWGIVSGGARGPDTWAETYATEQGLAATKISYRR